MLDSPIEARLSISLGQHSSAGRKPANQDFFGAVVPAGQALALKGVALAIADGISSSPVSRIAAETAVKSFLADYYCTSDAWSAKTAGARVIAAVNAWLNAQNAGFEDRDRAQVAGFSALVVKGRQAHIFHVGDARIARVSGDGLEPLTEDHRLVVSASQSYLSRALGLAPAVEIDYRAVTVGRGDLFVMTTDGIHDHLSARAIVALLRGAANLDAAARAIVAAALDAGSPDNLTLQIVRVDALPPPGGRAELIESEGLRLAPLPAIPSERDGFRIVRELHASDRSHVYLGIEIATGRRAALKFPSTALAADAVALRRFMSEEWVARRLNSPHVLRALPPPEGRTSLYTLTEFVEGQTLRQWMRDTPAPALDAVRDLVAQIALGLEAFHRKDMVHQDLRPENIMIDGDGTARIIDFGAVRVTGLAEARMDTESDVLGTQQYAAPEVLLGAPGTPASDIFSLGVIAYEMLTGVLPYGDTLARAPSGRAQRRLRYRPARARAPHLPDWVDHALERAVAIAPERRPEAAGDFCADLRQPAPGYRPGAALPLAERDPVRFWQTVSALLALSVLAFAALLLAAP